MVEIINFEYEDYNEYYLKIKGKDNPYIYGVYSGVVNDSHDDDERKTGDVYVEPETVYYRIKNSRDYFRLNDNKNSILFDKYYCEVEDVEFEHNSDLNYLHIVKYKHVILLQGTDYLHEFGKYMLNQVFRDQFSPIDFIIRKVDSVNDVSDAIYNNFSWLEKSFDGIKKNV